MECQTRIPNLNKDTDNDKDTSNNYSNYHNNYNNYLSCQLPPTGKSPPSSDFINLYFNHLLQNKKLDLTIKTYKDYK